MPRIGVLPIVTLVLLFGAVVGLQAVRDRRQPALPEHISGNLLYVRSGEFMKRAALSYDALVADAYWIRAVQHYGRTKLSTNPYKQYDLLYPLLDLTTSLDPRFNIAYRFGAIFLAEPRPGGAGRPDLAIALLEKGLHEQPTRWEYAQDIGFVHYWWRQDYVQAARWFKRASEMPDAANWLGPLAAVTLAQGGNRESSRTLWREVLNAHDQPEWVRVQAGFRLEQLDALDQIGALESVVRQYQQHTGAPPSSWVDVIRAGYLRGVPIDPHRFPYQLKAFSATVSLAPDSTLNPLPAPELPR